MDIQYVRHLHDEMAKKNPSCVGQEYMVFEKHDGWFGYLDFPSCIINSRSRREIPSMVELSDKIRAKKPDCKGRLIFEIMIEGLEVDSFYELNGILNRNEIAEDTYLRVHDYIPNFNPTRMDAEKRYCYAKEVVERLDLPEVIMSPVLCTSANAADWHTTCKDIWAQGREGVILKRSKGLYSPGKRQYDLMKIKESVTLELKVVGIERGEASGKYAHTLGKLVLQDNCGRTHRVSGMSDADRDLWYKNPQLIVDQIVEVKAMKKLKDGSLREPRFKAVRHDKLDID